MDTVSVMLAAWQYEWRQHGLELDVSTFWVHHGGDVTEDRYLKLAAAEGSSYDRAAGHARRTAYRDERSGPEPGHSAGETARLSADGMAEVIPLLGR